MTMPRLLLAVANEDGYLCGAAELILPPTFAALLAANVQAKANTITVTTHDLEPATWLDLDSIPAALREAMEEDLELSVALAEADILPCLATKPGGYPRGRTTDGYVRAVKGNWTATGVYWTAIASEGDNDDDVRIQTACLPHTHPALTSCPIPSV